MYNLAEEMKDVKPKYVYNEMLVYFDEHRMIFCPGGLSAFTVIKDINFQGAAKNLIKYCDIDDIEKSSTNLGNGVINHYDSIQPPTAYMSLTFSKEVLSIFNSIATCGESIVSNMTVGCKGNALVVYAYGIDYVILYDNQNYNTCPMNFLVNNGFGFAYYMYVLDKLYGTKDGLQINIQVTGKIIWIKCGAITFRIVHSYGILNDHSITKALINKVVSNTTVKANEKKSLAVVYGTRFKHLAKCLPDIVDTYHSDRSTVFINGFTSVILGNKK